MSPKKRSLAETSSIKSSDHENKKRKLKSSDTSTSIKHKTKKPSKGSGSKNNSSDDSDYQNDKEKSLSKAESSANKSHEGSYVSKRGRTIKKVLDISNQTESSESESSENHGSESDSSERNSDSGKIKHSSASNKCIRQVACKKCGTSFKTYLQLCSHMRSVHSKPQKCVICSDLLENYGYYISHMKSCHPEIELYPCKYPKCRSSFRTAKLLRDHEKVHYVYVCRYCKKGFAVKSFMLKHVQKVHL